MQHIGLYNAIVTTYFIRTSIYFMIARRYFADATIYLAFVKHNLVNSII